jgi:hypothetical protein
LTEDRKGAHEEGVIIRAFGVFQVLQVLVDDADTSIDEHGSIPEIKSARNFCAI